MSVTIGIKIPGANLERNTTDIARTLELLVATGYQAIEFSVDSFDLVECGVINRSFLSELTSLLDEYPLSPVIHVPLRLNLFNREYPGLHRQVLEACCEIAVSVGAGTVVYHPGRSIDNVEFLRMGKPERQVTFSPSLMAYERNVLTEIADAHPGIIIAMENQRSYQDYAPYSYAEFCTHLAQQITDINRDNVRAAIDTGHLNLTAAYHHLDISAELQALRPHIAHCHIHDNHGINSFYTDKDKSGMLPFGLGDEHLVPGTGSFPFDQFFPIMSGYTGTYMIELTTRLFYSTQIKRAYQQVRLMLENDGAIA